ncbi:hypothetical protein [Hymenobacter siberiensis]|uniref:hypothetical protein n=1 Tax=Hymenobacter siberiensis TaxID=2848396 RepID=UPI001C1E47DD|nr:hypothetical protein [Hymenobacter siberiensis]
MPKPYGTIPPLVLPDGTAYSPDAGTQNWQADGTSYQAPNPNGASRYLQDRSLDPGYVAPDSLGDISRRLAATASLKAPPFRPLSGPAPAADAAPAPAGAGGVLAGLLKGGLKSVGGAVARNPLGAVNGLMGVAGALEYATAKAPALPGVPDPYQPTIRPAQGLNAGALEAGRRGIQAAQTQAGLATGADTGTTAATRLLAQQQAGEQQSQLSLKDNEAFQGDQRRVDEQSNAAYDANYKTQRSYKERVFDIGQKSYEARRQQGAAMSQAALTYFTQDRAGQREDAARSKENELYARYGAVRGGSTKRRPATATETNVETDARGGRLPEAPAFGRGGKIKARFSFGNHAKARDSFAQRMDSITLQAKSAFDQSLLEASKKRSSGFKK